MGICGRDLNSQFGDISVDRRWKCREEFFELKEVGREAFKIISGTEFLNHLFDAVFRCV
jgi:hypothetical protein